MLKQILIAGLLVTMQASSPVPRKAAKAAAYSGNNSESEPKNHENTAKNPALLNKQNSASRPNQEAGTVASQDKEYKVNLTTVPILTVADKPKTWLDGFRDWGQWAFNLGLLVVGIMQAVVLYLAWKKTASQAYSMKRQSILMRGQLRLMKLQTDWLIETERPRLSIELDHFDPRQTTTGEHIVTGSVSIYGHTIAKVRNAEICVSTERYVVEDAFEPPVPNENFKPPQWRPDRIDLLRIIHPNSYDIRFAATVYSAPWKLFCRARIKYAAADKSWTEDLKMRFWIFGDGISVYDRP